MDELKREAKYTIDKKATKEFVKMALSRPDDSIERRCEISQLVEQAGQCADFIENLAKLCNIDLDQFVPRFFRLKE